jgi:flagellar biosynthetic protein FliO
MTGLVSLGGPRLRRQLLLGLGCAYVLVLAAPAAAGGYRDNTLLPSAIRHSAHTTVTAAVVSGTGDAALRMLGGLAIVVALILGLYKFLKRSSAKNDRTVRDDGWMRVVSSTPLAPARSLHLVRVGDEVVLLASSEQSVTTVRVYSAEEAKRLGVELDDLPEDAGGKNGANPRFGTALVESLKRITAR